MPKKQNLELSDDGPAARAAGFLNLAIDKLRVRYKIKYNRVSTEVDFGRGIASITLSGINPRHLIITRSDARILREITIRVIKKPTQFESLVINNKELVITFKF